MRTKLVGPCWLRKRDYYEYDDCLLLQKEARTSKKKEGKAWTNMKKHGKKTRTAKQKNKKTHETTRRKNKQFKHQTNEKET